MFHVPPSPVTLSRAVPRRVCYEARMSNQSIRIMGIDPGLRRTGWGVIESDGVRLIYVASGVITSDAEDDLAYRLRALYEGVSGVLASYKPAEAAVEETFVTITPAPP